MTRAKVTRPMLAIILMSIGVVALTAAAALAFGIPAALATLGIAAVAVSILLGWS